MSDIRWSLNGKAHDTILGMIGRTPLVKLNKIPKLYEVNADIFVKIEYVNPTGSLKDRIYYEMITKAIQNGLLNQGMEILEASTGNAGISCAFIGKLLGYKVTIVLPAGMSQERMKIIKAYGAEIITTPGAESDVDLCLEKIRELKEANPGKYWVPDQYSNPNNVLAHYKTTGPEIWEQTEGKIDCFIASQGTGGTISGVGRYLRERNPNIKLYAVEPAEAPMLSKKKWGSHKIEGIGDGFVPRNLDLGILNGIVNVTSEEAIEMAKKLALEEGIFCGISSGCNIAASIKVLKRHPEYKFVVTMVNDSGQRYLSTELCGERKIVEIPARSHILDDYTTQQLDKYQSNWEIIE
jgi:cysteine synthase A